MGLAGVGEDAVVGTGYFDAIEEVGVDRMASIRVGTALAEGAVGFRVCVGFSGVGGAVVVGLVQVGRCYQREIRRGLHETCRRWGC